MRVMRNLILVIVGCFVEASANARYTSCKDGWLPYQGSCYLFGHQLVHFTEAEHYCAQHGAHVVEMANSLENAFLKARLRDLKPQCFWLGLTDEAIEGVWRWYNSDEPTAFTDWGVGEPQDGGDCSVLWPAYDFKWGDWPCTNNCGPLCKVRGETESSEIVG